MGSTRGSRKGASPRDTDPSPPYVGKGQRTLRSRVRAGYCKPVPVIPAFADVLRAFRRRPRGHGDMGQEELASRPDKAASRDLGADVHAPIPALVVGRVCDGPSVQIAVVARCRVALAIAEIRGSPPCARTRSSAEAIARSASTVQPSAWPSVVITPRPSIILHRPRRAWPSASCAGVSCLLPRDVPVKA